MLAPAFSVLTDGEWWCDQRCSGETLGYPKAVPAGVSVPEHRWVDCLGASPRRRRSSVEGKKEKEECHDVAAALAPRKGSQSSPPPWFSVDCHLFEVVLCYCNKTFFFFFLKLRVMSVMTS